MLGETPHKYGAKAPLKKSKGENFMNRLYIAYGSNVNQTSMKYRCPQAKFVGTGTLKGYKLAFKGQENILMQLSKKTKNQALMLRYGL